MLHAALAEAASADSALRFVPPAAKAPDAARRLIARYGEGQEPRKSASALEALLRRIRVAQYDWARLDPVDRFDVAWVLWQGAAPVAEHKGFLQSFLDWLELPQRRFQAARLAIAWGAGFDPHLPSIAIAGAWLAAHAAWLPDPWPRLAAAFDIFSPEAGPTAFAEAFLASEESATSFFARIRLPARVANGGLGLEILAAVAAIVEARALQEPRLALRLCDLALHLLGPDAVARIAPRRVRALRRALAAALLSPWQWQAAPAAVKDRIIALLLRHNGDPRVSAEPWRDIDPTATTTIRRWLTERTVATYFGLAARKKSVDRAQLGERQRFWMSRLDRIDDAWILAGSQDVAALGAEAPAHGRLGGCRPDQSALLIRVADVTVLEATHEASETVWFPGNPFAPPLYRRANEPYWLGSLTRSPDFSSAYGHKSSLAWQERLAAFLDRQSEPKPAR